MTYSKTYLFAALGLLVSFGCAGEAARRAAGPAAVSEPVRHSCERCGPKCCRGCAVEEKRDKTLVAYARAAHDLLAACERKTLRAAEHEAAKGTSGEGRA